MWERRTLPWVLGHQARKEPTQLDTYEAFLAPSWTAISHLPSLQTFVGQSGPFGMPLNLQLFCPSLARVELIAHRLDEDDGTLPTRLRQLILAFTSFADGWFSPGVLDPLEVFVLRLGQVEALESIASAVRVCSSLWALPHR